MLQENPTNLPKFQIGAKGWFLTYPRCSLTKEEVLQALKGKRDGLNQVVVARELHEDGVPHIHCYLYYGKQFTCKNERFFDIQGFHPNIQSAKSLKAVQAYIKKDGDFIQEGIDYKAELNAIQNHQAVLGKRFLDGESPMLVLQDHPELFFQADKIDRCLAACAKWRTPVLPRCSGFIPNSFGQILTVSTCKQRHYWFWSESPNKGKTTFLRSIQDSFPSLWYSWSEKYQAPASQAQFVLLDEYSIGHLTVTQLNMMCDGTYQYPVKGSTPFALPDSIVLVCGNRNPLEIYDQKHHELLKARFNIICLDT